MDALKQVCMNTLET